MSPSFPITVAAGRVTESDQLSLIISADDREMTLIAPAHSPAYVSPDLDALSSRHRCRRLLRVLLATHLGEVAASPDAMGFSPPEDRA